MRVDEAREEQRARFAAARKGDPFAHADVVAASSVLDGNFPWPEVMPLRVERSRERALVAERIARAGLAALADGAAGAKLRRQARTWLREERFYAQLAAFREPDDVAYVLAEARAALESGSGDDVTTAAVRALAAFMDVDGDLPVGTAGAKLLAHREAAKAKVVEVVTALLIAGLFCENVIVVPACARTLADADVTSAKDALRAALVRLRQRAEHGYEERQALGTMALSLVALSGAKAANEVKAALAVVQGDDDTSHFGQLNAALWLATHDAAGARTFLNDERRKKGLAWAAAALADLADVESLPDLERARATLSSPSTALAFEEAMRRLRLASAAAAGGASKQGLTSSSSSSSSGWLVWSLGSVHPGEIALGVDSDNEFELEAAVVPVAAVEADAGLARDR